MPKKWVYKYGENTIVVKNENEVALYANDKLLDSVKGVVFQAKLQGELDNGEVIKASLGGAFTVKCDLSVNNFYLEPVEIS